MKKYQQLNPKLFKADNGFIGQYQKLIREVVIPYQYEVLQDKAEGAEKSHVIANFINAGKKLKNIKIDEDFYGMVFQDSDVAKWIEAAAYTLCNYKDEKLISCIDDVIDIIADAQEESGYLNTYYTLSEQDKRYTNLLEGHELYCAGHMIEAACAYYEATGHNKLLRVMEKNVDNIYDTFITKNHPGYPGHPEIELALMKMYYLTNNEKCLTLAKHFIDVRGVDNSYFENEAKNRNWSVWGSDGVDKYYQQSALPVRQQTEATGHAVRAVYLYTAMAELANESQDAQLLSACKALWNSITQKQMYVTGGIGSTVHGEAFSAAYDLPNDTAYCETCASIGLMFFADAMLKNELNSAYADVSERAFYNTVLAGMQLDGQHFFYVNPLECIPGITGNTKAHKHVLPTRPRWYACACCPPNTARLISSFGKYAYAEDDSSIYCHLYASGNITFENELELNCETNYPYDFTINYSILSGSKDMYIRIPGWSKKYSITLNGEEISPEIHNGYAKISVTKKDKISVVLDDSPYQLYASNRIAALSAKSCLARGPLVYCFEGVDNEDDVLSLALKPDAKFTVKPLKINSEITIDSICVNTLKSDTTNDLYTTNLPAWKEKTAIAIPYYTWCNRGENQMRVWLPLIM